MSALQLELKRPGSDYNYSKYYYRTYLRDFVITKKDSFASEVPETSVLNFADLLNRIN